MSAGSSNLSSWVSTTIAVWWSGRTCASASCGHSTMSSSADGIRSRVANFARASATIACQPSSFAPRHIASAVSTAPYTKRRGGGPYHSTKTFEPSSSVRSVLRPRRMSPSNCATASPSPSPTRSPDSRTSTFVPAVAPSTAVKRIPRSSDSRSSASRWIRLTGRFPAGERGGVWGTGRFPTLSGRRGHAGETWFPREREPKASVAHSVDPLEKDVDLAAARQADAPGEIVLDAVREELRLAAREHLLGVLEDVALDAAAGDRAAHLPRLGDREAGADRTRRRAARRDDGGDDDLLAVLLPAVDLGKDLFHAACLLSIPANTAPSSSRLLRLWPGRILIRDPNIPQRKNILDCRQNIK